MKFSALLIFCFPLFVKAQGRFIIQGTDTISVVSVKYYQGDSIRLINHTVLCTGNGTLSYPVLKVGNSYIKCDSATFINGIINAYNFTIASDTAADPSLKGDYLQYNLTKKMAFASGNIFCVVQDGYLLKADEATLFMNKSGYFLKN